MTDAADTPRRDPDERRNDALTELLRKGRRDEVDAELLSALEGDVDGERAAALAEALADAFAPPELVEPPSDLVAKTLDRCLVILPSSASEPEPELPAAGGSFRSSVEALTRLPLADPRGRGATNGRLMLRFVTQAAAAVALVTGCFLVSNVFQPAYAVAREEQAIRETQAKLKRLWEAAMQYQQEQPNAEPVKGPELVQRLIKGGYADITDFHCPGVPVISPRAVHFSGRLPAAEDKRRRPIFWDKFNNHINRINVVFTDGRVASVSSSQLVDYLIEPGDD